MWELSWFLRGHCAEAGVRAILGARWWIHGEFLVIRAMEEVRLLLLSFYVWECLFRSVSFVLTWSAIRSTCKGWNFTDIDFISSQHQFIIMSASKSRTIILTGGVAAITAMGAWYGATLKTESEVRQVCIWINFPLVFTTFIFLNPPKPQVHLRIGIKDAHATCLGKERSHWSNASGEDRAARNDESEVDDTKKWTRKEDWGIEEETGGRSCMKYISAVWIGFRSWTGEKAGRGRECEKDFIMVRLLLVPFLPLNLIKLNWPSTVATLRLQLEMTCGTRQNSLEESTVKLEEGGDDKTTQSGQIGRRRMRNSG